MLRGSLGAPEDLPKPTLRQGGFGQSRGRSIAHARWGACRSTEWR